jgi:hypothetical protein
MNEFLFKTSEPVLQSLYKRCTSDALVTEAECMPERTGPLEVDFRTIPVDKICFSSLVPSRKNGIPVFTILQESGGGAVNGDLQPTSPLYDFPNHDYGTYIKHQLYITF